MYHNKHKLITGGDMKREKGVDFKADSRKAMWRLIEDLRYDFLDLVIQLLNIDVAERTRDQIQKEIEKILIQYRIDRAGEYYYDPSFRTKIKKASVPHMEEEEVARLLSRFLLNEVEWHVKATWTRDLIKRELLKIYFDNIIPSNEMISDKTGKCRTCGKFFYHRTSHERKFCSDQCRVRNPNKQAYDKRYQKEQYQKAREFRNKFYSENDPPLEQYRREHLELGKKEGEKKFRKKYLDSYLKRIEPVAAYRGDIKRLLRKSLKWDL